MKKIRQETGRNDGWLKLLSVVVPVYNEEKTLNELVSIVQEVQLPAGIDKEIIVVDDGSSDRGIELLEGLIRERGYINIRIIRKENGGKGSAVRAGFAEVNGEVVIVQDADLEYDPQDYIEILEQFIDPDVNARVVYGSRIMYDNLAAKGRRNDRSSTGFYLGGRLVTLFTNLLYGTSLTDEPTCYKTFRTDLLRELNIENDGFEWEPEITAKIARMGITIFEVPIKYYPRDFREGKKIRWIDGLTALLTLLKYRFCSLTGRR